MALTPEQGLLTPRQTDSFRARTAAFVRARLMPRESDRANFDDQENLRLVLLERVRSGARLVDGASEVHTAVLARFLMDERDTFWRWDPSN